MIRPGTRMALGIGLFLFFCSCRLQGDPVHNLNLLRGGNPQERFACRLFYLRMAVPGTKFRRTVVDPSVFLAHLTRLSQQHGLSAEQTTQVERMAQLLLVLANDTAVRNRFHQWDWAFLSEQLNQHGVTPEELRLARELIQSIPENRRRWGLPFFQFGSLADFRPLMTAAGMSEANQRGALQLLTQLRGRTPHHPMLGRLLGRLSREWNRAVLCTGRDCSIAGGASHMGSRLGEIGTPDFPPPNQAFSPQHRFGLTLNAQFIHLARIGERGFDPLEFINSLVHEFQHWHDSQLYTSWVNANNHRIQNGLPPDPLFRQVMGIQPRTSSRAVVVISDRFDTLWGEARAYLISREVIRELSSPAELPFRLREIEGRFRRGFRSSDESMLRALGLSLDNMEGIFAWGVRTGERMRQTIREAGLPLPGGDTGSIQHPSPRVPTPTTEPSLPAGVYRPLQAGTGIPPEVIVRQNGRIAQFPEGYSVGFVVTNGRIQLRHMATGRTFEYAFSH